MHKRIVILGLVLLLLGATMLGWVLVEERKQQQEADENIEQCNELLQMPSEEPTQLPLGLDENGEPKTEAQLQQELQEKLQASLEKLAAGETGVYAFEEALYSKDRQNDLKKRSELSEFVFTGSIVCTSMGGAIFAWYLLLWMGRFLIKCLSELKKYLLDVFKKLTKTRREKLAETDTEKEKEEQEQTWNQHRSQLEKYSEFPRISGKHKSKLNEGQAALSTKSGSRSDNRKRTKKRLGIFADDNVEEIAVLLSDEISVDSIARLEDSPKAQTEQLEERAAQNVQQAIIEHSKPLDSTLKDLAQQVSAIREYAACQQERVEKLQDGYDWNIVRTFCLRIIRCIDNLENRINQFSIEGTETEHLEDIRDELIFALDSSGIEQFNPKINSDYRGQEKYAEAVKDKERCNNSKQKGKIAKVIRPGYQYFINEENIKVVRAAQVKLFG